ncbi:integrase core domain [Paramuricea clavata]|uniref:Integrase core domain, partial n=1 Tax=Paramuricea clavata TaxID=317549 RepID=A0A7D9LU65_PARCT|nr:integrase core domain [Paramuricea clavata]
MDSASSHSFVTVSASSVLRCPIVEREIDLSIKSLQTTRECKSNKVCVTLKARNREIKFNAFTTDHILSLDSLDMPTHVKQQYRLNENFPRPPCEVDILVGIGEYWQLIQQVAIRVSDTFVLLKTPWGHVPCGTDWTKEPKEDEPVCLMSSTERIAKALEMMWKLEELPFDNSSHELTRDEVRAVDMIENLLTLDEETSRFRTGLLWKEHPDLRNNYRGVKTRLDARIKQLEENPELGKAYRKSMQEFFSSGVVEKVIDRQPENKRGVYYLPHRAVYDTTRVTTKCRIVFDASAKTSTGKSLNNCLYAGPPLQLNIVAIELRFRMRKYALVGDISKMFLNIDIREEDRDFLRKWATNDPEILKEIPADERAPTEALYSRSPTPDEISAETSTLGVRWHPGKDIILFNQHGRLSEENKNTKTSVASLLAKLYDPLGLISPFVLLARKVMKTTFQLKLDWKDKLEGEILSDWEAWVEQIQQLEELEFPRFVENSSESEYHVFGDASSKTGFGAVTYVRTYNAAKNKYEAQLLMARAKVAPMKEISIPNLELKAALLVSEMATFLMTELQISKDQIYCWSDNEVTLWWLTKNPNHLVPFVANRVEKIQNIKIPFQYISTKENPADIASRGCLVEGLKDDLWLKGPAFLSLPRWEWKHPKVDFSKVDPKEGLRKQHVFLYISLTRPMNNARGERVDLEDYFSSYDGLLKHTATLYLCVERWRMKKEERQMTAPELKDAHRAKAWRHWIRAAQDKHYAKELMLLNKRQTIKEGKRLGNLSPFIDEEGLMRVGGRLQDSALPHTQKHPIILPKEHPISKMLAQKIHEQNQHAGIDWIHYHLRQKYWIIAGRQLARSVVHQCHACKKQNARRATQLMANLPKGRVTQELPFSHVGVDYTAAIQLKPHLRSKSTATIPGYIVIFTCLTTRAIHVEVVLSNHTEEFLMAFKRMVNTRGMPKCMYSDNAKTFKRAEKEILETLEHNNKAMTILTERYEFQWRYSTELAPHTGGIWERMVKAVKAPLMKVVQNALLTYIEMLTVCKEIEGQVNDRPLHEESTDSFGVITPSLLVLGRKLRPWPDRFDKTDLQQHADLRERWKHRKAIVNQFWRTWSNRYLTSQQQRNKWQEDKPDVKQGELVLLEKEKMKRNQWPVARIQEVKMGRDNKIRSVILALPPRDADGKIKKGAPLLITRSIHNIFPLEATRDGEKIPPLQNSGQQL